MTDQPWLNDPIIIARHRWWHGWLTPRVLDNQPPECIGCGRAKIHRWLGLDWLGYPFPLRIHFDRTMYMFTIKPMAGCGCIAALKRVVESFRRRGLLT